MTSKVLSSSTVDHWPFKFLKSQKKKKKDCRISIWHRKKAFLFFFPSSRSSFKDLRIYTYWSEGPKGWAWWQELCKQACQAPTAQQSQQGRSSSPEGQAGLGSNSSSSLISWVVGSLFSLPDPWLPTSSAKQYHSTIFPMWLFCELEIYIKCQVQHNRETSNPYAACPLGSSWGQNRPWEASQGLSWHCPGYMVC